MFELPGGRMVRAMARGTRNVLYIMIMTVTDSNPSQVKLGVHSTSIKVALKQKMYSRGFYCLLTVEVSSVPYFCD